MGEEGAQVLRRAVGVAALEEQEREAVVRAGQIPIELERAAIVPDRLVEAPRLGEGDRHVLENAGIGGMVAQRQPIRGQRGLVIALAFERERLVQIIEALGFELINARAAEEAAPETHAPKIACGRVTLQCSFPPHARLAPAPAAHIATIGSAPCQAYVDQWLECM